MIRTSHFKNTLLLLSTLVCFFIAVEVVLALFWPQTITKHQYHELYHPVMGWVNKPDMVGEVQVTRTISFHRQHNNQGLRSLRNTSYEKPSGIRRILLLGDSFFWGFGVNDNDVLSEILQQKVGARVEIINGAVTGYGTDQELLWLAEEGLKYRPDLVILGFFPTNDLDEISNSVMYGYPKPYFSLDAGRLVVHNIPVPDTRETRRKAFEEPDDWFGKLKKFLRYHVHTYQFIVGRLNSVPALRQFFLEIGLADEFTTALPGIPVYKLDPEKVQDLSNALIKEIQRVSKGSGPEFLLVFIPKKEQVNGSASSYEGGNPDDADWNTRVSSYLSGFTAKNKIPYLDLLPVVRQHQGKGKLLYTPREYDHHWTPLGHRLAAEAVYDWLVRNRWLSAPPKSH